MTTNTIEIYSDLICPWCYIGQHKMRNGLELLDGAPNPRICWKPFQLNPDMPIEGMDRKVYRSQKFGSWERSQEMDADVAAAGRSIGLSFNYDRVTMTPNTLVGHRLLWWTLPRGQQDPLAEALFRGYFSEGRDIGKHDVLAEIASEAGFDKAEVLKFLASEEGLNEVAEEEAQGRNLGVRGVPFFIINGTPAFSGAQSPEIFREAFRNAFGGTSQQCGADSYEMG